MYILWCLTKSLYVLFDLYAALKWVAARYKWLTGFCVWYFIENSNKFVKTNRMEIFEWWHNMIKAVDGEKLIVHE